MIKNEINDKTHNKVTNDNIKEKKTLNCNIKRERKDGRRGQTSPEI